jgi:hypothetical protein
MFYITEQLRYTAERDPLHEMHEDERRFLWSLRYQISQQVPNLLPKLLLCIEWNDYKETAEMLSLLPKWPKLPPARALELLDFAYADAGVRKIARNSKTNETFTQNMLSNNYRLEVSPLNAFVKSAMTSYYFTCFNLSKRSNTRATWSVI